MGFFDKLASFLGLKRCECNVLVVGLDNSGKTTVLNHFKPDEQKHLDIVPTVGFNVEKFKSRFCSCSMFRAHSLDRTVVSTFSQHLCIFYTKLTHISPIEFHLSFCFHLSLVKLFIM